MALKLRPFFPSIIGIKRKAVSSAFGEFISDGTATAEQIEFTGLVVDHLTQRGVMELDLFYESPFTDVASQGPVQVFDTVRIDRLFEVTWETGLCE